MLREISGSRYGELCTAEDLPRTRRHRYPPMCSEPLPMTGTGWEVFS